MNWTSIKQPSWRAQCEAFNAQNKPFEIRDVLTPDDVAAVLSFAQEQDIFSLKDGDKFWFRPGIPTLKRMPRARL